MTPAQFEIKLAVLSTSIRRCMDEMGRFKDATTRSGMRRYYEAQNEMDEWQKELATLLSDYYGEER